MMILVIIRLSSDKVSDFLSHKFRMGNDFTMTETFKRTNLQSGESSLQLLQSLFHVWFFRTVPYSDFCFRIGLIGVNFLIEL